MSTPKDIREIDRLIEQEAINFIHWWINPNRKSAVTNWTAGWERQIGYLMEFAASHKPEKS